MDGINEKKCMRGKIAWGHLNACGGQGQVTSVLRGEGPKSSGREIVPEKVQRKSRARTQGAGGSQAVTKSDQNIQ